MPKGRHAHGLGSGKGDEKRTSFVVVHVLSHGYLSCFARCLRCDCALPGSTGWWTYCARSEGWLRDVAAKDGWKIAIVLSYIRNSFNTKLDITLLVDRFLLSVVLFILLCVEPSLPLSLVLAGNSLYEILLAALLCLIHCQRADWRQCRFNSFLGLEWDLKRQRSVR